MCASSCIGMEIWKQWIIKKDTLLYQKVHFKKIFFFSVEFCWYFIEHFYLKLTKLSRIFFFSFSICICVCTQLRVQHIWKTRLWNCQLCKCGKTIEHHWINTNEKELPLYKEKRLNISLPTSQMTSQRLQQSHKPLPSPHYTV